MLQFPVSPSSSICCFVLFTPHWISFVFPSFPCWWSHLSAFSPLMFKNQSRKAVHLLQKLIRQAKWSCSLMARVTANKRKSSRAQAVCATSQDGNLPSDTYVTWNHVTTAFWTANSEQQDGKVDSHFTWCKKENVHLFLFTPKTWSLKYLVPNVWLLPS